MQGDLKRRFGKRVQELREAKHLTQEALAERVGRSVDTISAIERGVNATRIETASQLALALGVRLPELFDFEGIAIAPSDDREQAIAALISILEGAHVDTVLKLTTLVEVGLSLTQSAER